MTELSDKHGGFRRLHSFTLATIVQVETLRFCRHFLTFDRREAGPKFYGTKGRQYDQMTQAARSGRQHLIEGSKRSAISKDTGGNERLMTKRIDAVHSSVPLARLED